MQRPSSAIKELLENSLDAGATSITVVVKNGGLDLLQITDNGHGIHQDDLAIVCERFTTSKLTSFDDLKSIATFGFRGEALASITHVAKVSILTRTADAPCAFRASYCDGKMTGEGPKASAGVQGTSITVEDLFYNMPTRKTAFRNTNDEYLKILDVLSKYSILYGARGVSFTCKKHGKVSPDLHTPCHALTSTSAGSLENIRLVYGAAVAKELLDFNLQVDSLDRSAGSSSLDISADDSSLSRTDFGFSVTGRISNANYSSNAKNKAGSHYIFFVNGRLVESSALRKVCDTVYASILPKHSHAFCFLSLTLPGHCVDVNVHPTKREVHFLRQDAVLEFIYHALGDALKNANQSRSFTVQSLAAPLVPSLSQTVSAAASGVLSSIDETADAGSERKVEDPRVVDSVGRLNEATETNVSISEDPSTKRAELDTIAFVSSNTQSLDRLKELGAMGQRPNVGRKPRGWIERMNDTNGNTVSSATPPSATPASAVEMATAIAGATPNVLLRESKELAEGEIDFDAEFERAVNKVANKARRYGAYKDSPQLISTPVSTPSSSSPSSSSAAAAKIAPAPTRIQSSASATPSATGSSATSGQKRKTSDTITLLQSFANKTHSGSGGGGSNGRAMGSSAGTNSSSSAATVAPNKMVRVDAGLQKIQSFFRPVTSTQSLSSSTMSTAATAMDTAATTTIDLTAVESQAAVREDQEAAATTDSVTALEDDAFDSSWICLEAGALKEGITGGCICCAPSSQRLKRRRTANTDQVGPVADQHSNVEESNGLGAEEMEEGEDVPFTPVSNTQLQVASAASLSLTCTRCPLLSVRRLLQELDDGCDRVMERQLRQHTSLVGLVDASLCLVQCDTRLLLVRHSVLLRQLFYQLPLWRFGEVSSVWRLPGRGCEVLSLVSAVVFADLGEQREVLDAPLPAEDPNDPHLREHLVQDTQRVARKIVRLLAQKAEMLSEYFQVGFQVVSEEEVYLVHLPELLPGYQPMCVEQLLPRFLVKLAVQTRWMSEEECFRDVSGHLSWLYAPICTPWLKEDEASAQSQLHANQDEVSEDTRRVFEHVLFPALKKLLRPMQVPTIATADGMEDGQDDDVEGRRGDTVESTLRGRREAYVAAGGDHPLWLEVTALEKLYRVFERC